MKIDKNMQYALYFGGAILATYIVVKLIQNSKDNDDDTKTQTTEKEIVFTDKYLSTLSLGVDNLFWSSQVPTKYLPTFDTYSNSLADSNFKSKTKRVQTLLNQRIATFGGGFPKIVEDGVIGKETTKAMLLVANKYDKMNLLPLTKKEDIDKWLAFFNVRDTNDVTPKKELPFFF